MEEVGEVVPSDKENEDDDDELENLEDDDYELLEENLGIKFKRKNKYKRVRVIEDDSSSDEETQGKRNEKDIIASQLFEATADDDAHDMVDRRQHEERVSHYGSEESGSEDDFIVDDNNVPLSKRRSYFVDEEQDHALREAKDVFGYDFDFDEFNEYRDDTEGSGSEDAYDIGSKNRSDLHQVRSKPISEIFEPVELQRYGFTEVDENIRKTDIPERYQRRQVPVTKADHDELLAEVEWMYENSFKDREDLKSIEISTEQSLCTPSLRNQTETENWDVESTTFATIVDIEVPRTKKADVKTYEDAVKANMYKFLNYMRNHLYDVPFIAFYKKDEMKPYLEQILDCWEVYKMDALFQSFYKKKQKLLELVRSVQEYQGSILISEGSLPEAMKVIQDDLIEEIENYFRIEQVDDMNLHFEFQYSNELQRMKERANQIGMDIRQDNNSSDVGGNSGEVEVNLIDESPSSRKPYKAKYERPSSLKQYSTYKKAGLGSLVRKFGLSPSQFGESIRDSYPKCNIKECKQDPLDAASDYLSLGYWKTPDEVLDAAVFMVATELSREFSIRQGSRSLFFEKATLSVVPTTKGMKLIDENHPLVSMKFLKDKPVHLLNDDEFLNLVIAEQDKLITLTLGENIQGKSGLLVEEFKKYCIEESFAGHSRQWNKLRHAAIEMAFNKILFPLFRGELYFKLSGEAQEHILRVCSKKIFDMIKFAPVSVNYQDVEFPEGDGYSERPPTVLSIAFDEYNDESDTYACILGEDGILLDYLRLQHLTRSRSREAYINHKAADVMALSRLIDLKKPRIILIGGYSKKARWIKYDVGEAIKQLNGYPNIEVQICDTQVAVASASSYEARLEFPEYPRTLKEAISIGRFMLNSVHEVAQLFNFENDIMNLKLHPLQSHVQSESLLLNLQIQMVNRISDIGIDINKVASHAHHSGVLQFCSGFGIAKAKSLLKMMKTANRKLENRAQLVERYSLGPISFINCSGFIRIDTSGFSDDDVYVEILDSTRVHPQDYELARKIAFEALDLNELDEESLPSTAIEQLFSLREGDRFNKLSLLDYRQLSTDLAPDLKNPIAIVADIDMELKYPYRDLREKREPLSDEAEFYLLAKESPDTFYVGKLVNATVLRIERVISSNEEIEQLEPVIVEIGPPKLYQCPICCKDDFDSVDQFWHHVDEKLCPGCPVSISVMLDNGVPGDLAVENLSDKPRENPAKRVAPKQLIHCRVIFIHYRKFLVKVSSKSSDLKTSARSILLDDHYDHEKARIMTEGMASKSSNNKKPYVSRMVSHPSFRNITFQDAEKQLEDMSQGDFVIRPSSKGTDHLTITWKIVPEGGYYQHVDILEYDKDTPYSLGKTLVIGSEKFDDLDEIIARYIQPMAINAAEAVGYKYYNETDGETRQKAEVYLTSERRRDPNKIHYIISPSKQYSGKFLISYLPRNKIIQEYFTVFPEGFRFRNQKFSTLNTMLRYWKANYCCRC